MKPVNILMVDDQPAKLLTYEAMLGALGQNLLKAHSAREALAHLLAEEVAVVLMDVNMPELDGFELAAMIREHPRCQRTAIIFVSAVHLTDVDRLRGYGIGAVDYVSVPVVPEILRAKVGVFIDLYRKTVELEELNRTLEDRVSMRTIELEQSVARLRSSEQQLRQQSEALAEQDRRKNVFLAMLAHELRNPLQPISMMLELGRTTTDAPLREHERPIIERQVRQLVRLVDDLLDASRIARGKLELRRAAGQLASIVTAAVDAVRPLAEEKRQTLTVALPPERVELDCDAVRLTQVFQNLLNNAVKFTPRGGRITLAAEAAEHELSIRISDTGVGLAPDDHAKVFEMFYQGAGEAARPQTGLGLGLALVKQLVELHGGTVGVKSDGPGRGCVFSVRLPRVAAMPAAVAATAPTSPRAAARRILVVDDNEDAADSLAALLRTEGASVTALYSGRDALALLASDRPDVVILDLGMADLDGYETARAVRRDPAGRDVFLVALTGWGGSDVGRQTVDAGFDVHLVKPVTLADVMSALARVPLPRPEPPPARHDALRSGLQPPA